MATTTATQPAEFQDGGKPVSPPVYLTDAAGWSTAGTTATTVATNASDVIVKGSPGRLCRVIVTSTGTGATLIYDNANGHTGTVIGAVVASAAVGTFVECQAPAINGITVAGNANNSAITVIWS